MTEHCCPRFQSSMVAYSDAFAFELIGPLPCQNCRESLPQLHRPLRSFERILLRKMRTVRKLDVTLPYRHLHGRVEQFQLFLSLLRRPSIQNVIASKHVLVLAVSDRIDTTEWGHDLLGRFLDIHQTSHHDSTSEHVVVANCAKLCRDHP